jgi:hypothetical protein
MGSMQRRLKLDMMPQPDDVSCGATCLHAVYRHYVESLDLLQLIKEVGQLEGGGTLGVLLGCHALGRGYNVSLYNYNLTVFDPTWRDLDREQLIDRLQRQMAVKTQRRLKVASKAYIEFMQLGGEIRFTELSPKLIRRYTRGSVPVITGLSSTYLYQTAREYGPKSDADDVRGLPGGHFVVLCGYDMTTRSALVADPYQANPSKKRYYEVGINRLICSILLGVLTYDANLLVITPSRARS